MPQNWLNDDAGNRSSMRVAFVILLVVELTLIAIWVIAFLAERHKEYTDYSGLSYILAAIVGIGGLAGISKAIQKRYEKNNPHSSSLHSDKPNDEG